MIVMKTAALAAVFLCWFTAMTSAFADQNPLAAYQWQNRIVLLYAQKQNDERLRSQRESLLQHQDALADRELVVLRVTEDEPPEAVFENISGSGFFGNLIDFFDLGQDDFTLLFIGKDGTEKLRRNKVTEPREIFDLIDSMPMRQREMKRD